MFYLGIPVLQQVAADIADRPRELPFFGPGVIDDPPWPGAFVRCTCAWKSRPYPCSSNRPSY